MAYISTRKVKIVIMLFVHIVHTWWPKKVSHYQIIKKIVLDRIKACQWDWIYSSN